MEIKQIDNNGSNEPGNRSIQVQCNEQMKQNSNDSIAQLAAPAFDHDVEEKEMVLDNLQNQVNGDMIIAGINTYPIYNPGDVAMPVTPREGISDHYNRGTMTREYENGLGDV